MVTALSNKEWTFRLSAIRIGNTTHRLIMATRGNKSDLEGIFQQTLNSVRQVQPEEARRIRPLKLQIVTAQRGDTLQSLAARMPVDCPLERFLAAQRARSQRVPGRGRALQDRRGIMRNGGAFARSAVHLLLEHAEKGSDALGNPGLRRRRRRPGDSARPAPA